jgi:hypothetical protein
MELENFINKLEEELGNFELGYKESQPTETGPYKINPKKLITGFIHQKRRGGSEFWNIMNNFFKKNNNPERFEVTRHRLANHIVKGITSLSGSNKIKTAKNILEYAEEQKYELSENASQYLDDIRNTTDKQERGELALQCAMQHITDVVKEMYEVMPKNVASELLSSIAEELANSADPFVKGLHNNLKKGWAPYLKANDSNKPSIV